jgi:hypothetical protein
LDQLLKCESLAWNFNSLKQTPSPSLLDWDFVALPRKRFTPNDKSCQELFGGEIESQKSSDVKTRA